MTRTTTDLPRPLHESPAPVLPHAVARLQTLPGVGARVAAPVVSAIGTDMTCFPPARHLAAWAGRCPGTHPSAGQHLAGHTRTGHVSGRGALTQAAWAATRTQHTARAAPFRRLTTRVGKRRAWVAVGPSLLVLAGHLLSTHAASEALGRDDVDRSEAKTSRRQLLRNLAALDLNVVVEPAPSVSEASSCS